MNRGSRLSGSARTPAVRWEAMSLWVGWSGRCGGRWLRAKEAARQRRLRMDDKVHLLSSNSELRLWGTFRLSPVFGIAIALAWSTIPETEPKKAIPVSTRIPVEDRRKEK